METMALSAKAKKYKFEHNDHKKTLKNTLTLIFLTFPQVKTLL